LLLAGESTAAMSPLRRLLERVAVRFEGSELAVRAALAAE
jgi:hypothetical protein